jgi:hypothetical protein
MFLNISSVKYLWRHNIELVEPSHVDPLVLDRPPGSKSQEKSLSKGRRTLQKRFSTQVVLPIAYSPRTTEPRVNSIFASYAGAEHAFSLHLVWSVSGTGFYQFVLYM